MSDAPSFAKFVPGFDFLQNLSKGAQTSTTSASPLPGMSSWVAPTLDPEELEKRITDLKAVLFWLEQNTTALKATIQALEVQKMTLSALKNMNMDMSAMAKAFQFPDFSAVAQAAKASAPASAPEPSPSRAPATEPTPAPSSAATPEPSSAAADKTSTKTTTANLDPLQLWGSLTQQFQQIATQALQEVTKAQTPTASSKVAQAAPVSSSSSTPKSSMAATKKVAKKSAAKRPTAKKTS